MRSTSLGLKLMVECRTLALFVSSMHTDQASTAGRWSLARGTAVHQVTATRPDEFFVVTAAIRMFIAGCGFCDRGTNRTRASANASNRKAVINRRRFIDPTDRPHSRR